MAVSSTVVCCVQYSKGLKTDFDITLLITFSALRRQYANIQFQEPQTRYCLFDTPATPTLLYGVETLGPSLNKTNVYKDLEISLVSMTTCMIRSNPPVPHYIIQALIIILEALFRSRINIQHL